jgi:hypothetical protein
VQRNKYVQDATSVQARISHSCRFIPKEQLQRKASDVSDKRKAKISPSSIAVNTYVWRNVVLSANFVQKRQHIRYHNISTAVDSAALPINTI